jgi:hypothetical protein
MAGAGYKLFNTGDVLLASEVNTYLMQQTIMSFADSAARTTALSGVLAEGMVSYLRDTNVVEIYNGSAWASLDDPNAIQNTIVDAKGDIITATADNTPARLAVGGTNGQVLSVDSTAATGLAYANPGGMTLLSTTSLSGASVTVSSISQSYKNLYIEILGMTNATADGFFRIAPNNTSTGYFTGVNGAVAFAYGSSTYRSVGNITRTNGDNCFVLTISNYANSSFSVKPVQFYGFYATPDTSINSGGMFYGAVAVTSVTVSNSGGNLSTGTLKIYGVN